MSQVVSRLFDNYADAESAVRELETAGVRHHDITLVCNDELSRRRAAQADDEGDVPGHASRAAAEVGGEVGGVAGLLAGIGVLAIPGIGPVMAAGWIVSAIAGAVIGVTAGSAAGGLVGALTHHGVHEGDAHVYAEGVCRGATLVSAKVPHDLVPGVEAIFHRFAGVDAATRGAEYRASGWTRFQHAPAP
ncbi:MAG TPA: hypothetical protein VK801_19855 [Caulobacteraceae bacterium]|jgi:hypothetical protein|nr:hypothetical protein [Caulobacteraceae bacterium]